VHHTSSLGVWIEQHPHAAKVGLHLAAGLWVDDAHRVVLGPGELLGAEPLQRALGNLYATTDEQVADLGDGEVAIQPRLDLVFVRGEQLPRGSVFTRP